MELGRAAGLTLLVLAGLVLAGLVLAGPARAADGRAIWMHGTGGVAPCAACHGIDGQGRGIGAPRLAGLAAPSVEASLVRLAAGGGVMGLIASRLTPDQRAAVASYVAGLPAK